MSEQITYWESQRQRRDPSDPVIAAFVQPKLDFIKEYIELSPQAHIIDVGCGNGYFTYYLQALGQTVGIDYAKTMLRQNPCHSLSQASAVQLPFGNGTFDLSFCSNILHHIEEPLAVIAEMKRVSKHYVVLSEPNRNNPAMLALGLFKKEERNILRFTWLYLRSLAERAGLHILACETMGFVTPNRMPRFVVAMVSRFNQPNPFGAYSVLIAQREEELTGRRDEESLF